MKLIKFTFFSLFFNKVYAVKIGDNAPIYFKDKPNKWKGMSNAFLTKSTSNIL